MYTLFDYAGNIWHIFVWNECGPGAERFRGGTVWSHNGGKGLGSGLYRSLYKT